MFAEMSKGAVALLALAALAACGGGGGGGGGSSSARISVADARFEEGAARTSELVFRIGFDQPSAGLTFNYETESTAKSGGGSTGAALGGSRCEPGVDYIAVGQGSFVIPNGRRSAEVKITVCGDGLFEPTETFAVKWSAGGRSGTAIGTIVNDDAGGLNGTGVAGSYGRDSDALTNDDADGRAGFSFAKAPSAANFRCTRDQVTGLLWEGKTTSGVSDAGATYTFRELRSFVDAVNAQALCGFTDWRVPTPEELSSIVDAGKRSAPTADTDWFPNQQAASYWTATSYQDGVGQDAWYVDFATGTVAVDNKSRRFHARLVTRGGTREAAPLPESCADTTRFADHRDGTVSDRRTGLMWKQCAEGLSGSNCTGTEAALTWPEAVARPAAVNDDRALRLGYDDWRLPTRAELSSIAEREQCFSPAANPTVFPNTGAVGYWTATPYAFNDSLAWSVDFNDGQVGPGTTTGTGSSAKRVRLVRAGQ